LGLAGKPNPAQADSYGRQAIRFHHVILPVFSLEIFPNLCQS